MFTSRKVSFWGRRRRCPPAGGPGVLVARRPERGLVAAGDLDRGRWRWRLQSWANTTSHSIVFGSKSGCPRGRRRCKLLQALSCPWVVVERGAPGDRRKVRGGRRSRSPRTLEHAMGGGDTILGATSEPPQNRRSNAFPAKRAGFAVMAACHGHSSIVVALPPTIRDHLLSLESGADFAAPPPATSSALARYTPGATFTPGASA